MGYLVCALIGYLIGTINPSYIYGKIRGFDIRRRGSGNAGASNATTVLGKKVGVVCALCDILKAVLAYKLVQMLFPALPIAGMLSGIACVAGHIFPFWMGFKGGTALCDQLFMDL